MIPRRDSRGLGALTMLAASVWLLASGCFSPGNVGQQGLAQTATSAPTPTDPWSDLLRRTAYPYTLALPKPTQTALDGTYVKIEPQMAEHVHCLRCPDYAPEGGVWKLQFDGGVYRIYYAATGWRSLGSFILSKDRRTAGTQDELVLFNDPNCPEYVATYSWKLEGGALILNALEDTCSIQLRAMNLTHMPWLSCEPPAQGSASGGVWSKPAGCD